MTLVTTPTRPSAVTTGSLSRTPLSEPAAMRIACVNAHARAADDLGHRPGRSRPGSAGRRCSRAARAGTRSPGARTRSGSPADEARAPPARSSSASERAVRRLSAQPYTSRNGCATRSSPTANGRSAVAPADWTPLNGPLVARPERERDEHERREDEHADDEPTAKRPRAARGNRRGDTPDCQAQRRRSRAALPGHGEPV